MNDSYVLMQIFSKLESKDRECIRKVSKLFHKESKWVHPPSAYIHALQIGNKLFANQLWNLFLKHGDPCHGGRIDYDVMDAAIDYDMEEHVQHVFTHGYTSKPPKHPKSALLRFEDEFKLGNAWVSMSPEDRLGWRHKYRKQLLTQYRESALNVLHIGDQGAFVAWLMHQEEKIKNMWTMLPCEEKEYREQLVKKDMVIYKLARKRHLALFGSERKKRAMQAPYPPCLLSPCENFVADFLSSHDQEENALENAWTTWNHMTSSERAAWDKAFVKMFEKKEKKYQARWDSCNYVKRLRRSASDEEN